MNPHPEKIGRYEIQGILGHGGMGIVYLAWDPRLKRHRAIKTLPQLSDQEASVVLAEAQTMAKLEHPNIVTVFECSDGDDADAYMVMEYLRRGMLRPYIGRLTLAQAGGVLQGVLLGLEAGEKREIIHRDIKPENLLVDGNGWVKIADYGIAKARSTGPGTAIGTPGYMAPEQINSEPVGPTADLYSLGCVAYELIAGERPFADTTEPLPLAIKHLNEEIPPLCSVQTILNPAWGDWVDRLLLKDPGERPASAALARFELEALLIKEYGGHWRDDAPLGDPPGPGGRRRAPTVKGAGGDPPPTGPGETPGADVVEPPPLWHRRRIGALLLTLVLLLGSAAGAYAWMTRTPPPVDVGALLVLDGPSGASDKDVFEGAQFAVDFLNGEGPWAGGAGRDLKLNMTAGAGIPSLRGAKLRLHEPDRLPTRCNVRSVVDAFVDRTKVSAVIGAYSSTITVRGISAAHEREVPLFNAGSTVTSLTQDAAPNTKVTTRCGTELQKIDDHRGTQWFFRVGPTNAEHTRRFADLLEDNGLGDAKKIAVLHGNADIYGNGAWTDTQATFGKRAKSFGYQTTLDSDRATPGTVRPGSADPCEQPAMLEELRERVAEVIAYEPDVIIAASYPPDAVAILQLMAQAKYDPPAFISFGSGYLGTAFVDGVRADHDDCGLDAANPNGVISPAAWSGESDGWSEDTAAIAARFEITHGKMNSRNAIGFTAMLALAEAIDEAGSRKPAEIRDALSALSIPEQQTMMGWGIDFESSGENGQAVSVLEQLQGDSYRTVFPGEWQRSPIFPVADAR